MGKALSKKDLKFHGNGIFYIEDFEIEAPKEIKIDGHKYLRFCDFIYIPASTEKLSKEQIISTNALRKNYFEKHPEFKKNLKVHELFYSLISELKVKNILEFGSGYNPSLFDFQGEIQYSDFDPEVVNHLSRFGLKSHVFSTDNTLNIENEEIDLVISIFVLHFKISDLQMSELFRILAKDGVFLFNLYSRSKNSRLELKQKLEKVGFYVARIEDEHNICSNHEYWILFKNKSSKIKTKILDFFS